MEELLKQYKTDIEIFESSCNRWKDQPDSLEFEKVKLRLRFSRDMVSQIESALEKLSKRDNESCNISDVSGALPTNETIEQELLNRFGFNKEGGVNCEGQLKIFDFMKWLKEAR